MAVDLGVVYAERRELRNGADAGALAIAADCGMGTRPCDEVTALATAEEYADANAWDGSSSIDGVELTFTGLDTGWVRVRTRAWDAAAGESGVRVPLLSLLGFNRVQVGAAATALFDHPGSGGGIPLIIGKCEFCTAIGGCPPGPGSIFGSGSQTTLVFKDPSQDPEAACPADPAGKDAPGSFGWLDTDGTMCWVETSIDLPQVADPGVSPSTGCDPADLVAARQHPILIPVYTKICKNPDGTQCEGQAGGGNTYYYIEGYASYQMTAYYLGGQYRYPTGFSCNTGNSSDRCISGYFTTSELETGDTGGADFGVVLVKLTE